MLQLDGQPTALCNCIAWLFHAHPGNDGACRHQWHPPARSSDLQPEWPCTGTALAASVCCKSGICRLGGCVSRTLPLSGRLFCSSPHSTEKYHHMAGHVQNRPSQRKHLPERCRGDHEALSLRRISLASFQ